MIAKRLLVGLVAFGLAVLGLIAVELAPIVRAQEPPPAVMPHGDYDQDTELCAVCHDWHAEIDTATDPEQVLAFPWEQLLTEPSELELCYSCHDGSPSSETDIEGDFGNPGRKSFHPVLAPADDILLACSDCHAQHQYPGDPEDPHDDDNVALLYRVLDLDPLSYQWSSRAKPIGNDFCYGCHGSSGRQLPAPFGDHGAFGGTAHDDPGIEPPTPGTDLRCSVCHEPHASNYSYLTRQDEEDLCYTCHSSATNSAKGSNPQDAFSVPNDYVDDADGIRIYHHPVAEDEQEDGTRTVECASCHNSHLVTSTYAVSDPARARAMDTPGWRFYWDEASGNYNRSIAQELGGISPAAEFCGRCHRAPSQENPILTASTQMPFDVPYDVNLVEDSHDKFDLSWFLTGTDSAHGNPDYVPAPYPGCPPGGDCELACTACHDFHGSSNAFMLREDIASPDYRPLTITLATWGTGTATLTVLEPHRILAGWYVGVQGVSPAAYNGIRQVTAVTETTVSFALAANPGPGSGGTLVGRGPYDRSPTETITGFDGTNAAALQTFCLTCHLEFPTADHDDEGKPLCTDCHNHDPNADAPF